MIQAFFGKFVAINANHHLPTHINNTCGTIRAELNCQHLATFLTFGRKMSAFVNVYRMGM